MGQWFFPIFDRADFWNFGSESCSLGPDGSQRAVFSFPFLIGSNFGSHDSRGTVVIFSFSPGEISTLRGGFLAPTAAVVVCFDSDAGLVPTAARWRWFFPVFDRVEFWLRRQPRTCRFFQFFTRWNDQVDFWLRELQLWLALIPMCFWSPWQPAGSGFFPFLIGPTFGSDDRRGPYVFFSFSPGGFSGSESCSCVCLFVWLFVCLIVSLCVFVCLLLVCMFC